MTPNFKLLSPDRLHPNPDNPRLEAGDVTELARSIKELGQLQPLLVRLAPELCRVDSGNGNIIDDHYYIEAGERRWLAMKYLGMDIECRIREPEENESPRRRNIVVGLVENVWRKELDPIEKAKAFGRLRNEEEMTQEEIGKATGFHPTSVNRYLALLELAPKTQEAVREGKLSAEDALRLVRQHRAQERKRGGKQSLNVEWEPDYLTPRHPLARTARTLCAARGHTKRRLIGRVACGQCWETAIRQDEATVQRANFEGNGRNVNFVQPDWPVDSSMSRTNGKENT